MIGAKWNGPEDENAGGAALDVRALTSVICSLCFHMQFRRHDKLFGGPLDAAGMLRSLSAYGFACVCAGILGPARCGGFEASR